MFQTIFSSRRPHPVEVEKFPRPTSDFGLRTSDFPSSAAGGRRAAFTIVEVLTVVSIIAILLGMVGAASHAARQKAYRAQAAAEAGEIANACRAFWIASGNWKNGPYWPGGTGMAGHSGQKIFKDGEIYNSLIGKDGKLNPAKTVFLQFDENRFDDDGAYSDPWGNAYEISFADVKESTITHHFKTSVTFPMRNRREYYGNQFEN